MTIHGYGVSLGDDENILELNSGNGGTAYEHTYTKLHMWLA